MAEAPLDERWRRLVEQEWTTADAFSTRAAELRAVRAVAAGGLGAGRVFDGHRNALERLMQHRPSDIPEDVRNRVSAGVLRLGVWGADPGPQDGTPACLNPDQQTVSGVKAFCSGAGHLDLAIVLVRRTPEGPPTLPALIDLREPERARVDLEWFRGSVLAQSHSHRVVFDRAPVVAILGEEGTLSQEPWISGDALRSAAVWAGAADTIAATVTAGAGRSDEAAAAAGCARAILGPVNTWLDAGLAAVNEAHEAGSDPWPVVAALRLELTERLRTLSRIAAEQHGSRGLATDETLAEARADLDLLLLQHRSRPSPSSSAPSRRSARDRPRTARKLRSALP
ncbi:MAG: hypothetical protein AAGC46_16235 [Solirubrobacteraceae bacterium]|nr:hypothetical protein [Patulibacter sp.]